MKRFTITVLTCAMAMIPLAARVSAQGAPTIAQAENHDLSELEKELVPLAEAMPENKYNFAPTSGEFKNVRTFALQIRHIATVIYEASSGILGEKVPVAVGEHENGADSLNNKAAIVKYLKDAFTYAHRAVNSITAANALQPVDKPWKSTRLQLANVLVWHSYDHYGQCVEYLRLNGIVPPASR